jgi:hypothetical protein
MLNYPCSSVGSTRLSAFALVRTEQPAYGRDGPAARISASLWGLAAGFGSLDELRQLDETDAKGLGDVADCPPLRRAAPKLDLGQSSGRDAGIEGNIFLATFWLAQAQFTQDGAQRKVGSLGGYWHTVDVAWCACSSLWSRRWIL